MNAKRLCTILTLALALIALVGLPAIAQRGDDSDRKSKNGKTQGTIDGVAVTLEYGRPKVNERAIWGGLVPYGEVWRTGANEATTISFSKAVKVEGETLPAGTYGLFTIPGENEWTVIFNQVSEQWGAFNYDASKDALRVTAKPKSHDHVEELDFVLEDGAVVLRWAELALPVQVEAAG